MTSALFRCDGAPQPQGRGQWEVTDTLRSVGPKANVDLHIESPSHSLLSPISKRSADLVRIAAFVYVADQAVSRGGEADVYGDKWKRQFTLCIPVSDPWFWNNREVRLRLKEALGFLSEDDWNFVFSQGGEEEQQLPLKVEPSSLLGEPDCVLLFSGGLDSLCAAVEAATAGRRPLLIGHSPAFHIESVQRDVAGALRAKFTRKWHFPYLSSAIHRSGGEDPKEYTQRTRSFLYASIGAAIAEKLKLRDVILADNGIVSLSLPVNEQLIGARISRSTHPKFIRFFNELSALVFRDAPVVMNPLWSRTRPECLQVLRQARMADLIERTNSCARRRTRTRAQPHCGICSQCVDRRFGTIAAGLEDHDPGERYELDIFRSEIPEGTARTLTLSYVRFAQKLSRFSGEQFFTELPALMESVPLDDSQKEVAEALAGLLGRHASSVLSVVEAKLRARSRDLARSRLPEHSLLRLVAGSGDRADEVFVPSADYRSVRLNGRYFGLTAKQGIVVREIHLGGNLPLSEAYLLEKAEAGPNTTLYQLFRRSDAWGTLIIRAGRGLYKLNY